MLVLDTDDRIVAVLLGMPDDPEWPDVVSQAVNAMARACRDARQHGWLPAAHRRGRYLALTTGVSFGGGQKVLFTSSRCYWYSWLIQRPGNLVNSRFYKRLIRRLLRNKAIRRLAGFQSS